MLPHRFFPVFLKLCRKDKETESTAEKYSEEKEDDSNENPTEPAAENDSNEIDSNEKDE